MALARIRMCARAAASAAAAAPANANAVAKCRQAKRAPTRTGEAHCASTHTHTCATRANMIMRSHRADDSNRKLSANAQCTGAICCCAPECTYLLAAAAAVRAGKRLHSGTRLRPPRLARSRSRVYLYLCASALAFALAARDFDARVGGFARQMLAREPRSGERERHLRRKERERELQI